MGYLRDFSRGQWRGFNILLLSIFLASCSVGGGMFSHENNPLSLEANASSEYYLRQATQSTNMTEKADYQLLATRVLVSENKLDQAQAQLNLFTQLTEAQTTEKNMLTAQIFALKKETALAEQTLALVNLASLSTNQKARYYEVEAQIALNKNYVEDALKAHIKIDSLLQDNERKQHNNDQTWQLLRQTNPYVLKLIEPRGNIALEGWLSLIKRYNDNLAQPVVLQQALKDWKQAYPHHTATYFTPKALQQLVGFRQTEFSQLGLLLPLSGSVGILGETIKKGFDDAKGDSPVNVTVFDTTTQSIDEILQQIKQNGITYVVGPLLKNNVDVLSNHRNTKGLTILTLNSQTQPPRYAPICYYALAPEDEAQAASERMWQDHIQNPLVIAPQNNLGQRTAAAFNQHWQRLTGHDAITHFYRQTEDILPLLQANLTEEHPFQGVYAIADSNQLSLVKNFVDNSPTHLPIYGYSRSHSANNGPEFRFSMEGVTFSEIPFLADSDSEQFKQVFQQTYGDYSLMRLYAMGADAWLLINHINELRHIPGYRLTGLTGKLITTNDQCNILRDFTWLQYSGGMIKTIH